MFAQSPSPSPTASATPSSSPLSSPEVKSVRDAVRERVEEKLNQLSNKPKAYVGKITDIQDSSLVVETKNGIRQIKLTEKTTVVQITKKGRKEIKAKDLAIGNFAVVMGFVEMKEVLTASRILTIEQLPQPTKRAVYGIVQTNEKGTLIIKHPKKDEVWTIKTTNKTQVTKKVEEKMEKVKITDIAVGDRIAAAGTPEKEQNTLLARLIHVIPGEAKGLLQSPTSTPKPSPSPTQ